MQPSDSPSPHRLTPSLKLPETTAALGTALLLILAVGIAGVGRMLLPGDLLDSPLVLPAGAIAAVLGLGVAVFQPRWILYGFLLACMGAPFFLEETAIPLGFMKLYIQDLVFLYCAGLILIRSTLGLTKWRSIPFNRMVVLHFLLGVWGVFVGLKLTGHAFDYTFGDFRRAFFYFMNYFVILLLTDNFRDVRRLRGILAAGGILIIAKGAFQALTGQFYTRRAGDAAHILSHYELTFLSFVVFLALGNLLFNPAARRSFWALTAAGGAVATVIGNYRAAWLSLIGGLIFMFIYVPRRGKLMLAGLGLLGALFLGLSIAALWDVEVEGHSTLGQDIMAKAKVGETTQDVNVTWRFASYENAYNLFRLSPWIGRGLGEELEFSAPTSTGGAMMARAHRVHNSFLWLLMSLGVTGFVVFLTIQAVYFATLVRYLRSSTWPEGRITVLACGAFYISFMISTSFEIFLESAMPITVLSASMALALLTIYYTPRSNN